jgi:hypothetical protein
MPTGNFTLPKEWPHPEPEQLGKLIEFLAPYVMWLDPTIVGEIVHHNTLHRSGWEDELRQFADIPLDAYFWDKSACVFPGIRRATGNEDRNDFKALGCLKTDSSNNYYPNITWGYLMVGKQSFDKSDKAETGLAHLFPHKDDSRDVYLAKAAAIQSQAMVPTPEEVEGADPGIVHAPADYANWLTGPVAALKKLTQAYSLSGLFTSAANMCFLPAELTKPTDVQGPLLLVLLLKAQDLYGKDGTCNLFPYGLTLGDPDVLLKQSKVGLTWADVQSLNWCKRYTGDPKQVKTLNQYRTKAVKDLVIKKKDALTK